MASTQSFCIHRAVATAPSNVRIDGAIDRFRPDASASREEDEEDDAGGCLVVGLVILHSRRRFKPNKALLFVLYIVYSVVFMSGSILLEKKKTRECVVVEAKNAIFATSKNDS